MFLLANIPLKTHVSLFGFLEQIISFNLFLLFGLLLSRLMNQVSYMVDLSLNCTGT